MNEQDRAFYLEWLPLLTKYSEKYYERMSDKELEIEYAKAFEGRTE